MRILRPLVFLFILVLLLPNCYDTSYATSNFEENILLFYSEEYLENGAKIVDEVYIQSRASTNTKTATRTKSIYSSSDVLLAIISFKATFQYDGNSVSVLSKTVTQTDTYNGWSYSQTSFSSSGGTVILEGKLTKMIIFVKQFTMTLTCDVNGNISYS